MNVNGGIDIMEKKNMDWIGILLDRIGIRPRDARRSKARNLACLAARCIFQGERLPRDTGPGNGRQNRRQTHAAAFGRPARYISA